MADGSIVFDTRIDNKTAEKELTRLKKKVQSLNDDIYLKQQQKLPLVEQAKKLGAELDAAKAKLSEMQTGGSFYTNSRIKEQAEYVERLQTEWNKVQNSVERYDASIQKANIALGLEKERAGSIQASLATSSVDSEKMASATKKANKSAIGFARQLKYAMSSIIIFSLLFQAFASFTEWVGKVIAVNDEASAAIGRLKGALLTLVQPLLNVIIPALTAFANILADVFNAVANILSRLFGSTIEQSSNAAESLYNETQAIEGVGSAAEKAEKQLASFDEINKLSDSTSGGGAGAGAATEGIQPIFGDFSTAEYQAKIDELTAIVSGALLALGAILTFSGANIPLGISLMAVGAIGLVSLLKQDWNAMPENVKQALTAVLLVLGTASVAIGAILAFSGVNIPLGLALIAAGAASLVTAASLNWDSLSSNVKNTITAILEILGMALLAVGGVLALSGANIPLGLALLAAGAVSLASAVALNWESVKNDVSAAVTELLLILSGALLVIGSVLAFSGANLPLGIALIAAGAASLAVAAVLNWQAIVEAIRGPIGQVMAIGSASLLALGLILALSGVALPLGIALIAAGAAGLVTVAALNWNAILEKLQESWAAIQDWWNKNVSKYLTAEYWSQKFSDIGDAIFNAIKSAINGVLSVIEGAINFVIDGINSLIGLWNNTIGILGALFGIPTLDYIPNIQIPRLAQGAVIPPNKEFLAVLGDQKQGTNIEAPLDTILRAFRQALSEMNYSGGQNEAVFEVDGQQFAKLVYKYNNKESRRVGVSLSEG